MTSIDLSLGEPAIPASPEVIERAHEIVRSGPQGYTENAGMLALREAIGRHYHLEGRDEAENVLVTVGSEEAVFLAMMSVLDPGDEVLVPDPGYPAYRGIAQVLGAVPVAYPIVRETGLVARSDALAARITPRTRALVLNGPSNPFGTIDEPEELERIARLIETHGMIVLSDEIYRDLTFTPSPPPTITTMTPESVSISGLSKSCSMTGLRVGYMITGATLVKLRPSRSSFSSDLNGDLSGDFVRPVFPDSALKRPCPVTVVS